MNARFVRIDAVDFNIILGYSLNMKYRHSASVTGVEGKVMLYVNFFSIRTPFPQTHSLPSIIRIPHPTPSQQ